MLVVVGCYDTDYSYHVFIDLFSLTIYFRLDFRAIIKYNSNPKFLISLSQNLKEKWVNQVLYLVSILLARLAICNTAFHVASL